MLGFTPTLGQSGVVTGLIDEEFAENALRVFDPRTVVAGLVEGWSV